MLPTHCFNLLNAKLSAATSLRAETSRAPPTTRRSGVPSDPSRRLGGGLFADGRPRSGLACPSRPARVQNTGVCAVCVCTPEPEIKGT